jgi:hypothetical protein
MTLIEMTRSAVGAECAVMPEGRERFRRTCNGTVVSSGGFSVHIPGQTGIEYRDKLGELRIDSEDMNVPGVSEVVFVRRVPDTPERPREEVFANLRRAFDFAGWEICFLDESDSEAPSVT